MRRATLLLLLAAAPLCFGQDKDGWISLFNGKDFTGWKVNENNDTFTIKDGAIQAQGPRSHCFYVGPVGNHDFTNFELKVDVKTAPVSNGGIYFHTEYQDVGFPEKGFEVQVNNTHGDLVKSGSLYHVKDIGRRHYRPDRQGRRVVHRAHRGKGKTVTISLNGKQVVEWTQPDDWNGGREGPGRVISHGTIALQGHDPKSIVQYKNIQIKILK